MCIGGGGGVDDPNLGVPMLYIEIYVSTLPNGRRYEQVSQYQVRLRETRVYEALFSVPGDLVALFIYFYNGAKFVFIGLPFHFS